MFTFVLFNHSFGKFWKKHVFTAFYFTERYFNFTLDILLLQGNIINIIKNNNNKKFSTTWYDDEVGGTRY